MSYCAFENTLKDMRQCLDALREAGSMEELLEDASWQEAKAIKKMPEVLTDMLRRFEDLE